MPSLDLGRINCQRSCSLNQPAFAVKTVLDLVKLTVAGNLKFAEWARIRVDDLNRMGWVGAGTASGREGDE